MKVRVGAEGGESGEGGRRGEWCKVDDDGGRGNGVKWTGKGGEEECVWDLTIPLQCSQTDVPMKVCSTKLCVNLSRRRELALRK